MIKTSPKPLPSIIPHPKRERLPKGRAVTIGMGFRCSDGIVVCADTQITWQGHKDYECKVYYLSGHDWTMASVYAGSPHLMKSFIIPSKEIGMFKTEGKIASAVPSFDYVGCGDSSLLRYLGPILADKQQWLSINQALRVGTSCILQAKRYVEDCGGETDAFVLGWNGSMQTRSGMTYNWEQHFLRLERDLTSILRAIGNATVNDEEFENRLNAFSKHVREERVLAEH